MANRCVVLAAILILPVLMLPAGHAGAQTLPWPGETVPDGTPPPPGQGVAPWPAKPPGQPAPTGGGAGSEATSCMAEFSRLRADVEKKGQAAKEASQRKVGREEMCKYVTIYAAAEEKFVNFTVAGLESCGIPAQIADQLKQVHANTEQTKEKICVAGPFAAPGAD
jgi:hypothetical protein